MITVSCSLGASRYLEVSSCNGPAHVPVLFYLSNGRPSRPMPSSFTWTFDRYADEGY